MKELEKVLKALANRRRLAILKYLKHKKEASVSDIAREIKLSFKSTSRHLTVLRSTEIVEREQRNLQVFYMLANDQGATVRHVLSLF